MLWRVEVGLKKNVRDVHGNKVSRKIREELGIEAGEVRTIKVYTVEGLEKADIDKVLELGVLHDPVLHIPSLTPLAADFAWNLEVGFRPGVTDNEGRTAKESLVLVINPEDAAKVKVYTSTQYIFSEKLEKEQIASIAKDLLANELIQRYEICSADEWEKSPGFEAKAAQVTGKASDEVAIIDLLAMNDDEMMAFSRANTLAMSIEEFHSIRDYYSDPEVLAERKKMGIDPNPTDAELEALAQTWSEHCKHKIFSSKIEYENRETGVSTTVDSLYKSCIQNTTKEIRKDKGDDDFCLSVFKDNAGVIKFNEKLNVCVKMETHNSPSALDPYGGALTGIVGVNRDPMGTGLGANLLCNTDVFCFASPFYEGELPPRLLHPRRVLEGVREGVEHGGNKSGVPTVNGSIVFDERYLGKPLVYCGTVGTMPVKVAGRLSHEKKAQVGDIIVMTGGRIGKDGIHGATFSSEELHEGSPATAVQIGDPITQRKMYDCLMRARDTGLYSAITDNGAGGLSSSVGEMAEDTGGCDLDLAKAPLKYDGLKPWEILVSEAQERMTLAVPPEKLDEFMALAKEMDVEATALGTYTDSGIYNIRYGDKPVAALRMDFLHDGVPQMQLKAVWDRPVVDFKGEPEVKDHTALLKDMLGRLNICSKEYVIRQYDHEVQGRSVVKPLVGKKQDGPADAGVLRPDLDSDKGLVVSHGICPKFSDLDTYWMMANAIDEAVRNAVAVGGDISHMAGIDNFCWCDPVQSETTPDGHYKLAQLVRANQALSHFSRAYGVPCISGKDSMKNDYKGGGVKISIPPTVLFSAVGIVPDVNKCVTSDFKNPGDFVYVLGITRNELGGSEVSSQLDFVHPSVPHVEALTALKRYETVQTAMSQGLISACHDLSDGGLGVALAEMSIGGRIGVEADLCSVPSEYGLSTLAILYSESASRFVVTVSPEHAQKFEALFEGQVFGRIGMTTGLDTFGLAEGTTGIVRSKIHLLADAFKGTLDW
ncbi:phosphoribosylformylglycinamidine synthase subunit PurS [Maridesulfovibrio ferrireducens]|uniref:phosphoribosylformylglycinamidine synthase subunit PurS n=1 Tax=Maridesulfovibrio ferrireducens TaxID=246191 RepID=UPI001A19D6D7|nr:phosphoribosylformylglycinamidine synthase subunit PurS [Maridesulfovibrio ferrireducens]MBI9109811.1 phosphoribosylformylglycinamidine synthase subunit PurS [Maridesulfovibrio ferrireducens]